MTLDDIKERITPMLHDVNWARKALDEADNAFTRRAYVRSLFAMIEGTLWVLKQTILHAPSEPGQAKELSVADYAILAEKSYDLKSNGQPFERPKFLRLPDNLRFTFRIITRYSRVPLNLKEGTTTWEAFLRAHTLRNRITHPKAPQDFEISTEELEDCKTTNSWFYSLILDVFKGLTGPG